ncbi:permease [Paenibacillus aestuarii]|uniref:Permease n=1 Tax=Paenibacillus aestuarii TaxID=516965 RepID=A0ABW0K2B5_9BACL|nr:permease [Paenibacillus aestuarii]
MQTAVANKSSAWNSNVLAGFCLAFILALYFISTAAPGTVLTNTKLQIFKTMFISIILEAMPFILIGVFISALLQVFVTDQMIKKMIPSHPLLGILTASIIGIIFPICECGMVPAIRKLMKKGMPLYVATTLILVGPILNPIVFWSTFIAFRSNPEIAYARMGLAFVVALVAGLIVYKFVNPDQLKEHAPVQQHKVKKTLKSVKGSSKAAHTHDHTHTHTHAHVHNQDHGHDQIRPNKVVEVMGHTVSEFFDMGKFLLFGALLVGLLQTFVSKDSLVALGHGQGSANVFMMGLGFILSLCSTSDAFVAQSFLTTFSKGSLIAFMVFGPMLNLKGLFMMSAVFKAKFVVILSVLVIVLVYAGTLLLEGFVLK